MWCPLPWTHVAIKNNGSLKMCSHSQQTGSGNTLFYNKRKQLSVNDLSPDVLNCDTLKEVRREFMSGNWPSQCNRCQIENEANGNSRNNWETEKHKDIFTYEDAVKRTLEDGTFVDPEILDYDMRIGNQCNLRCVMCFPGESSKWYDIYEDVMETDVFIADGKQYNINSTQNEFGWIRNRDNVERVVKAAPLLKKINFGGGEPIVIKQHMDILRGLIDNDRAKDVEIEYSINITSLPESLFPLWKHFRKIILCCSLDALGSANEAIRYPSKWDKVEANLKFIDSLDDYIQAFTSITVNILSLEHFADLMDWIDKQQFKKINKYKGHPNLASHPVYNPKYLSIAILEPHQFNRIWMKKPNLKQEYYNELYNQIKLDDKDAIQHRKDFVKRFYKFQKLQNQDWTTIFPEAYNVVREWESNSYV